MKNSIRIAAFVLTLCSVALAQETRNQITIQGSAAFTRKSTDAGITYKPTSSGGFLVGYRLNINRWLGVEGDYDHFRNTQKYLAPGNVPLLAEKTDVHAVTASAVINIPNPVTKRMRSYLMVGGGALLFRPRDAAIVDSQMKGSIVFGGGLDVAITTHLLIRAQCRNFMYKAPDFKIGGLQRDKFTQTMVPSVGLVFTF